MQMQMKEFKWTFGDKPEKSYINQQKQPIEIANTNMNANTNPANNNPINEFSNHIGEFRKASNKRENVNEKLNERLSVGQVGQNPFNTENNYIRDLEVQQNFLMPKSSYDEIK
jgi:hypothetical protein